MNQRPELEHSDLIKQNLAGNYHFDLEKILKTGFERTLKHYGTFFKMMLVLFAIVFAIFYLFIKIENINVAEQLTQTQIVSFQLVTQVLMAPFLAAFMLQGVRATVESRSSVKQIFELLPQSLSIVIISVFVALLTGLGMGLYFIPGIYIFIACGFSILLTAERRLTPMQSIVLSVRMVNRYFGKFLILYAFFGILLVLSILTYGLGFLLMYPFYHTVKGVLYRDLFGYGKIPDQLGSTREESTFEA